MSPLRLRVPATTANLGAGYDLIGAALNLYNHFTFESSDHLSLHLSGPRASECRFQLDDNSLIVRAFRRVYHEVGQNAPNFSLSQDVQVPPSRGLGSSSTAIVAGLLAANQWLNQPLGEQDLVRLATELEGHPDNVAPALLGGCVLNFPDGSWTQLPASDSLVWVVCIPEFELETAKARSVVPREVSLGKAVQNMAWLGALVAGLSLDNDTLLRQGLQDGLHQPYRQTLVPGMPEVMQAALAHNALGCVLSGAGPTLLALCRQHAHSENTQSETAQTMGLAMREAWAQAGIQSAYVICGLDPDGAVCLD